MAVAKKPAKKKKPISTPIEQPTQVSEYTKAEIKALRASVQDVEVRVEVLTSTGIQKLARLEVPRGQWCAMFPKKPPARRYQYVLQWQADSPKGKDFILCHLVDGVGATRLPPANGWIRALDRGELQVLTSDVLLSRRQIAAIIGGHEPPSGIAKPPNT
jgi:hypothetical protein